MSTLAEIESAAKMLPRPEQETLLRHLAEWLGSGPTCYDLARDLFEQPGHLGASGQRDLSTNKSHLVDFGLAPRPHAR